MSNQKLNGLTTQSTVSVIMNCFNYSKYLREAIDSVYAQTYKDWEIIFWDNASTDNSAEIARSYDGRLRYFRSKETVPLGKARNWAIEKAKGKYIAFLDCDDIWLPQKLEKQIPLFELNSDCGLVYTDAYRIDKNGNIIGQFSDAINFLRGRIFYKLLYDNVISAFSSVVLSKKALDKVGMFDLKYEIFEDYDIFLKIAESFEIDYKSEPLVKFRHHDVNTSKKIDVGVREGFEILEFWLKRRPEIEETHKELIKLRKFLLHSKLALFYARKGNLITALKCFNNALNNLGYRLLPIVKALYKHLYLRRIRLFFKKHLNKGGRTY